MSATALYTSALSSVRTHICIKSENIGYLLHGILILAACLCVRCCLFFPHFFVGLEINYLNIHKASKATFVTSMHNFA